MKTNAIVRIVIWSLVIVVLLGILSIGLGVTRILPSKTIAASPAETAIPQRIEATEAQVYLESVFYAEQSISVHSKPASTAEVLGMVEAGDTVHLTRDEMVKGQHWGYILQPLQGWILLDNYPEEPASSLPVETIAPPYQPYTATVDTNLRVMPDKTSQNIGIVAAGQTVTPTQIQMINGHYWGHIQEPQEGWFLMIDYAAEPEEPVGETIPPTVSDGSTSTEPMVQESPDIYGYACNAADVSDISIEWAAGNIQIVPVDGSRISVRETGDVEKYPMVLKNKNGKLSIEYCEERALVGIRLGKEYKKDLTIEIPKNHVLRELEIEAASAAVLVQELEIRNVEFDGASGRCEFQNCQVGQLDIDTASGDISFTGTLNVLECDAASANFVGILSNVPRSIEMESMSGNLDLTLPENAGYTVIMEGMNTKLSSDFETTLKGNAHISGDGACRIQMEAMNADVIIRKAK